MCRPRVFATTLLQDDARLRQTWLREVSSPSHASSRRRVSSPDLSSGSVLTRPCVFATTRVLARPVFRKCLRDGACLRPPMCLRDDACSHPTCLREASSPAHARTWLHYWKCLGKGRALGKCLRSPKIFAPRSVFAGNVSSDAHVFSLSSPGMCLLTPRCLPRPCFEASVLDPACLQNVSSVFGQYVHPPRRPQCKEGRQENIVIRDFPTLPAPPSGFPSGFNKRD